MNIKSITFRPRTGRGDSDRRNLFRHHEARVRNLAAKYALALLRAYETVSNEFGHQFALEHIKRSGSSLEIQGF